MANYEFIANNITYSFGEKGTIFFEKGKIYNSEIVNMFSATARKAKFKKVEEKEPEKLTGKAPVKKEVPEKKEVAGKTTRKRKKR